MSSSCAAHAFTWKCSAPVTGFFHAYEAREIRRSQLLAVDKRGKGGEERAFHGHYFDLIFCPRR
jgi:hypothetical protein